MTPTKNPTYTYRYINAAAWLLLAQGAAACVERGASDFPDQALEDAGGAARGGDAGTRTLGGGQGAADMTGTWLRVHETSTCVLGNEQLTVTDYLVDVTQAGPTLTERHRICAIALSPIIGLSITVPREAFSSVEFPGVDRGVVSGTALGSGYTSPTEVSLWGYTSSDPLDDPLPDEPGDVGVEDADADGNPGVTFGVGGSCSRYVTQRQFIRYQGTFTGPSRIDGGSTAVTESNVLGATSGICATAPSLAPNDDDNRFVMVRVDGVGGAYDADADADGAITCAEVQGLGAQLIASREPERANCSN